MVCAVGSSHRYVKGAVPPVIVTVASPLLSPLQSTIVLSDIAAVPPPRSFIVAVAVAVHPF